MRSLRVALLLAVLAGCGSRTGLLVDEVEGPSGSSSSPAPGCADASSTLIYVVTTENVLFAFNPSNDAFTRVGTIGCLPSAALQAFSMAVSRSGTAYVLFNDGEIFAVSTADASCTATPFQPNPPGFEATFGMGFASNAPLDGETLYVAGYEQPQLGSIDTTTFAFRAIGSAPAGAELTGAASGFLYAFFATPSDLSTTQIVPLDKATGGESGPGWTLPLPRGGGWAFAYWGGAFYTFTGEGPPTMQTTAVRRFDPSTQRLNVLSHFDQLVVGAGVSTCAPGP
jgi:hypothetical protein